MLSLRHRIGLELSLPMINGVIREHPLTALFWECTLRCNLRCRHCGSDCRVESALKDMPLNDFLPVLDSIARETDPHRVMINVTGGEPLVRKDLEECGKAFYDRGFPWGIVTNGQLLTPERFHSLLRSGLRAVTVSLDGIGETHDWMRGVPGSFGKALAAARMVAGSGAVEYDVVTCVNKRSYKELDRIKELLIENGIKAWRLFTVFSVGRAAHDPELRLSGEEFRGLMEFIKRTRREGRIKASYGCEGFLGNFEGDVRDRFFLCSAGITIGSVMADGSIAACPSIRADYSQGNIYKGDDFMDVWNNRYGIYRDHGWMKTGECASCRYWRYCRGNGMHLRDADGQLIFCHLHRIQEK
ncbi:MAG: TIGR04133 family radical SAM/SPASM protein [Bacteroidales bacterium]|nr:TIGR04133 family radical SAM/SPASM protein [Bacteroidales bacterium]